MIWYTAVPAPAALQSVDRPLAGGNVIAQIANSTGPGQVLRIMDPLGNPVRETTVARIDEQLAVMTSTPGHTIDPINQMSHEANLLSNGHIVILGYIEHLLPIGTQNSTTGLPVDVLADEIVDLDPNLQVDWTWNPFDYLDITRAATLQETCRAGVPGCPSTLRYGTQSGGTANDWTHANAITFSASDHNLLLSVRSQDWILKLRYLDATGDGTILWHLGNQGDYALTNPPNGDAFPWFSHQHGIAINSSDVLDTFDNGNTRCKSGPPCDSRGQVYQLDEVGKTATLLVDADAGHYSQALGWAQTLANGDFSFTVGNLAQPSPSNVPYSLNEEFSSNGLVVTYEQQAQPEFLYRAYRMPSMYAGCCGG